MVFKNIGVVAHSPQGARVLMIRRAHLTTLAVRHAGDTNDRIHQRLNGETVTITADGQRLWGRSLRPTGERLVHLDWVLDRPAALKTSLSGLINADVYLPAGRIIEQPPEFRDKRFAPFGEDVWQFRVAGSHDPIHEQKLTNVVEHRTALDSGRGYELRINDTPIHGFDGTGDVTIVIENSEDPAAQVDPGTPWNGKLDDFQFIYDVVQPATSVRPFVQASGNIAAPGTGWTRPICPKVQMDI